MPTPAPIRIALLTLTASLLLAACAAPPHRSYRTVRQVEPVAPPPSSRVYFYPDQGQSPEQQDRDRYECNGWAVRQSGFDPSLPQPNVSRHILSRPDPEPGRDTAAGTVVGAMVGAVASDPHHTAEGMAVGALAGAVIGAVSDQNRKEAADRAESAAIEREQSRSDRLAGNINDYRRAMSACLSGRGYTVR
ncbi:glycine zipper 2TM domain-containing protein [Chitinimonas sp.]|uniref:glycine zipper 2TM domain-containing protein n=1 Tax=Chitinimonas sp. TaxID=1934313 RepID=UPI002F92B368